MEWTRGHTIGHGSSATVSIARDCSSGEVFAVKSVDLSKSKVVQREERILSKLVSPYIVKYLGSDVRMENGVVMYNLFMEYVSSGTLVDLIRKEGGSIDESMIRDRLREILEGLEYLHSSGIVHCDIKGSNILVGSDGAKIADLGCAKCVEKTALNADEEDKKTSVIAGTPLFMAPEVARGEEQSFAADVWAVGCVVIEMATGCAPWTNVDDPISILYRIGYSDETPEAPSFLSDQAKDFLSKCLVRNPKERWSVSKLLKHPFLIETGSNFKVTNSPTSVLDQDLWSSIQEWNATSNLTNTSDSYSNSISPSMRLRQLSRGGIFASPSMPNWAWDENWVTVRSNSDYDSIATNEIEKASEVNTVLTSEEVDMELPENSVAFEDLLNCFVTDTGHRSSGSNLCNTIYAQFCNSVFTYLKFDNKQNFRFTHSFSTLLWGILNVGVTSEETSEGSEAEGGEPFTPLEMRVRKFNASISREVNGSPPSTSLPSLVSSLISSPRSLTPLL